MKIIISLSKIDFVDQSEPMPEVHYGIVGVTELNWRKSPDESVDDDQELETTPDDVVSILGFDPKHL